MSSEQRSTLRLPNISGSYYDRISQARRHMDREELEEAAAIFRRLIERLSRLPEHRRRPYSQLGSVLAMAAADLNQVYLLQGRHEEADELSRQLEVWDPEAADFWRRRVFLGQIERGQIAEGLERLWQLAQDEDDNYAHWLVFAQQALSAEQGDRVEEALARAQSVVPEEEAAQALVHFAHFRYFEYRAAWTEAIEAWERAVALNPNLNATCEDLLKELLTAGQLDLAARCVNEESLSIPGASFYRALIAYHRGDRVSARYLWRQVSETDLAIHPDAAALKAMAHCWLGQPLKALSTLLNEAQAGREMPARFGFVLALAWAMQGNLESARANLAMAGIKPAQRLLDSWDWRHFDALVEDERIKQELRGFFAD